MAKRKFKLTVFARMLILLVIVAPLAYIGASYYNGEDGIENIKNLFSKVSTTEPEKGAEKQETPPEVLEKEVSPVVVNSEIAKLRDELVFKNERIDSLYLENAALKEQLKAREEELIERTEQLNKIKNAIGN